MDTLDDRQILELQPLNFWFYFFFGLSGLSSKYKYTCPQSRSPRSSPDVPTIGARLWAQRSIVKQESGAAVYGHNGAVRSGPLGR